MRDKLLIIAFLVLLLLPCSLHAVRGFVGTSPQILEMENRASATFPVLEDHETARSFTMAIENWLSDQFGLRQGYLSLYRSVRDALGLATDGQVIEGQEGWLFLNHGDMLDEYQGYVAIDPAAIEHTVTSLSSLAPEDTLTMYLFPPNKQSVYGAYLPPFVKRMDRPRRREVIQKELAASGWPVVDPLPTLQLAREKGELVYHLTDSHWTDQGAYLTYEMLIAALRARGVDVVLLPSRRLKAVPKEDFQGDLVTLLGGGPYAESQPRRLIRKPVKSMKTVLPREGRPETTWPIVYQQDLPGAPTLLISGDSFSEALLPFLKQSFSVITVVRREPNIFYADDFKQIEADVVLIEMVERLFVIDIDIRP